MNTEKKPNVIIKSKTRFIEAMGKMATKATTKEGDYYFIPYWFKKKGQYDIEVVEVENIPDDLKEFLQKERMIIAKTKKDANNGQ